MSASRTEKAVEALLNIPKEEEIAKNLAEDPHVACVQRGIGVLAQEAGFDSLSKEALDCLTEVWLGLAQKIAEDIHTSGETFGRLLGSQVDLSFALVENGISIKGLNTYIEDLASNPALQELALSPPRPVRLLSEPGFEPKIENHHRHRGFIPKTTQTIPDHLPPVPDIPRRKHKVDPFGFEIPPPEVPRTLNRKQQLQANALFLRNLNQFYIRADKSPLEMKAAILHPHFHKPVTPEEWDLWTQTRDEWTGEKQGFRKKAKNKGDKKPAEIVLLRRQEQDEEVAERKLDEEPFQETEIAGDEVAKSHEEQLVEQETPQEKGDKTEVQHVAETPAAGNDQGPTRESLDQLTVGKEAAGEKEDSTERKMQKRKKKGVKEGQWNELMKPLMPLERMQNLPIAHPVKDKLPYLRALLAKGPRGKLPKGVGPQWSAGILSTTEASSSAPPGLPMDSTLYSGMHTIHELISLSKRKHDVHPLPVSSDSDSEPEPLPNPTEDAKTTCCGLLKIYCCCDNAEAELPITMTEDGVKHEEDKGVKSKRRGPPKGQKKKGGQGGRGRKKKAKEPSPKEPLPPPSPEVISSTASNLIDIDDDIFGALADANEELEHEVFPSSSSEEDDFAYNREDSANAVNSSQDDIPVAPSGNLSKTSEKTSEEKDIFAIKKKKLRKMVTRFYKKREEVSTDDDEDQVKVIDKKEGDSNGYMEYIKPLPWHLLHAGSGQAKADSSAAGDDQGTQVPLLGAMSNPFAEPPAGYVPVEQAVLPSRAAESSRDLEAFQVEATKIRKELEDLFI